MRKRKTLTIDDILTDRDFQIRAAPCWAYGKPTKKGYDTIRKPIAELWKGVLAKLRRNAAARYQTQLDDYNAYLARVAAGKLTELDRIWKRQPPVKTKVVPPGVSGWELVLTCAECRAEFYGHGGRRSHRNPRQCSNACEAAKRRRWGQAASVKRADQRAADRTGRTCGYCGEPLNAQRSTSKFCSTKCRVYAARKRKPPRTRSCG